MSKSGLISLVFLSLLVFCSRELFAAAGLEDGVSQLANQISKSMQEKQGKKIAIIDFPDLNGNVTTLGQFMAEELTTQLFLMAPGKFEVVERRQLLRLQEELALGQTGLIEEKSLKKMGQMLGVDAIVTGSMTDLGSTIKINARLIGVESAKVFAVAATDIPKTGAVADLIAKQAQGNHRTENSPSSSTFPPLKDQTDEAKEILFQLQSAKLSGKTLITTFVVKNKGKDRQLCIKLRRDERTRVVDDQGNEYAVTGAQLGKESEGSQILCNNIVSGIPTGLTLKFEGISSEPKSLALLQIDCNFLMMGWNFMDDFSVQFRDISLMR